MLPDDDKQYAIEICRSSESVLKKWFKNKLHTISAFVGFVIIIKIILVSEPVSSPGTSSYLGPYSFQPIIEKGN